MRSLCGAFICLVGPRFFCRAFIKDSMFTAAPQLCSNLEPGSPCSSTAMAKRSATSCEESVKLKEFVVRPYTEVDLAQFSVKQRGTQKNGDPFFTASYDHSQLVINLTPKSWLRIPFAIEDKFSKEASGEFETLSVNVEVDDDLAKVISGIECVAKRFVESVKPGMLWRESVKSSPEHGQRFASKLVLKAGNNKHLTMCTVRPFGREVVKGAGSDFITPLLEASRGFRNAKVKMAVALHSVWIMKTTTKDNELQQTAGINWRITNIMADVPEQVEFVYQDIFANEVFEDQE